jgi:hypothetical protein
MPALTNQRQERFCQLIKQGVPPYRAYPLAGYNANNGAPYRLAENVRIKRRLNELTRSLAVKTRVTVESITEELDAIRDGANAALQFGAAKGAVETKAKLHGLLIERKEAGAPGDFAGLQSVDDVLALVKAELGDETATVLASVLARRDQGTAIENVEEFPDLGDTPTEGNA